ETTTDVVEEVVDLQLLLEDDADSGSYDESDLSDHEASDLSDDSDIEEPEIVEFPSYPSNASHVPDTILQSSMEPTPTD
ncbi:hypothetical protein BGX20_008012, partial [Mortierella sp. AD010]